MDETLHAGQSQVIETVRTIVNFRFVRENEAARRQTLRRKVYRTSTRTF
jgi:hypothetical protein